MRYGNKIIQGNTSPHQTKAELVEQIKTMNHNYQVLHEQHERGYTYSIKTIRDLESKLEIARKALEDIKSDYELYAKQGCRMDPNETDMYNYACKALEQIEHKGQQ